MPETFGVAARPRVLLAGMPTDDPLVEQVAALAPTTRHFETVAEMTQRIRQQDWDAVIVDGAVETRFQSHLFVIHIGGRRAEAYESPTATAMMGFQGRTNAAEFRSGDDLPHGVDSLVRALAPRLLEQDGIPFMGLQVLEDRRPSGGSGTANDDLKGVILPFVQDPDGKAPAGRFIRSTVREPSPYEERHVEWWMLPDFIDDYGPWVGVALDHWSRILPSSFPAAAGGRTTSRASLSTPQT